MVIPKLGTQKFKIDSNSVMRILWRENTANSMVHHWLDFLKLRSSEGQTYACCKIITNILNLSSHILTTLETNLLNKGLTFVQTPMISKAPILEATRDFRRNLKIKYFFPYERNNFNKPQKCFIAKSNWVPPDKGTDPDLIECINNFTTEIDELNVLREEEKTNLRIEEKLTLNNLRKNKDIVIKKLITVR